MIISVDLARQITQFNRAAEQVFGYTAEEIVGRPVDTLYADPQESLRVHQFTLMNGQFVQEVLNRRKDGELFTSFLSATILQTEGGKIIGYTGISRDVSEQKRAQESLHETRQRYRAFVQHSSEAIWRVELQKPIAIGLPADDQVQQLLESGFIAECNDEMAKMYGYRRAEDFMGTRISQFLLPNDPHLKQFVQCGYRVRDIESQEVDRHGKTKYFRNNFVGIVENGHLVRLWGTQTDVTERHLAEEKLVAMNRRLHQIAQMTSAVIGSMPALEQAQLLVAKVREAFEVDACVIRLLENDKLILLAQTGIPHDLIQLERDADEGVSKEILSKRGPVFVADTRLQPHADMLTRPNCYYFLSYAGAPLLRENVVVGILAIYSEKHIRNFSDADLEHLQIVANHISVSIINDRLYKELHKSELQLRLVWENSLDGMRLVDRHGIVRLVNDAYCRLVGKNRRELEGNDLTACYAPGEALEVLRRHKERFESRTIPAHTEKQYVLWSGRKVFLELTNTLLEFEGQEPLVLTLFRDITERKKAELRNHVFTTLAQKLSAGRTDAEVAESVLNAADNLLGWHAAYLIRYFAETKQKTAITYFDTINGERMAMSVDEVGPVLSPQLQKVVSDGAQMILRNRTEPPIGFIPFGDKSRPSASILLVPIRHKDQVIGILSIQSYDYDAYTAEDLQLLQTLADFSGSTLERMSTELALTEERNLLRTLIDNLPDYIYVKDAQSRHLLDNVAHRKLLGAQQTDDIIGKTASDYFPPALANQYLRDDQLVLQSGQPLLDREEPHVGPSGAQRWLLTTKVPFRDKRGEIVGLVGISRDITTHKLAETRSRAFANLAQRLSGVTTMEDAGGTIVDIADELLGWDCCYLHLCTAGHDSIQSILSIDTVNGERQSFQSQLQKPSAQMFKAMRDGGQLILREEPFQTTPEFTPFGNDSRPSASIIIVPVRNNTNVIGVLSVQSYTKLAYDHKALETLQALADYCGGALERLKNDAARIRIERRNLVLSNLAHSLSSADTQEEAARVIVAAASDLFEWNACAIDIYLPESDLAHSLIVIDTIDGKRVSLDEVSDATPSAMFRRVVRHGGELILRTPESLASTDTVLFGDRNRRSASLMVVPIRHGDRVIGVFSIQSYSFNAYSKDELVGLQALADYCGGALERIRGIEALRESEQRFRSLSESTPVGIFQTDAEGRRIYINQRWYTIAGMQPGEGLGDDWIRSLHPDERERIVETWRRCLAEGKEWISEHRLATRLTLPRWVRVIAVPITSKDGRRTSYVGTVEDISVRKQIEQRNAAFSKLGQKLSSASNPQEAARVIGDMAEELFLWDAFSLDLYSSDEDRYESVLNIDTVDAVKRDVPHTNPSAKPTPRARRIMENGPELILKKDPAVPLPDSVPFGAARPSASIMLVPLRDRNRVVGVLSVQSYTPQAYDGEDLRILQLLADYCGGALERIRAEEALRSSEMRFHSVWESSVDGMRLTDENGVIIAVNQAYCQLVGMPREDLEGKPFTAAYAASEKLEESLSKYKVRFQRRSIEPLIKRRVVFRNGSEVDVENASSFIEARDGKSLVLGLFRDVTAQKRLEEELRQSQKLESIGRLAGGVAHDFNNLLTVINGHAEMILLDRDLLPIDAADSIEQIGKAAERAAGLTRQLLAFGRKQIMQPKNIDLNEAVSNMTKMLQRMLGEDICLQVSFHSHLPVIYADPTMIEQILLNLAVNSRDAMPRGGELVIQTTTRFIDEAYVQENPEANAGQFVSMSVRDTGCGIPPENLPQIFEPFFTTKDVGKGTGLGLATVYGIVKQHRGWINVESEVEKGTVFEVFLPTGTGQADESESPQKFGMRSGSETLLLVEDEREVRSLAVSVLQKLGYRCFEAATAAEALEVWKKNRDAIELVLTDVVMPNGMSGRDLAEELHALSPGLKILFTSGYPKDVIGKDFILREGVNFLQKPYTTQKLAETIRDCLDSGNIIHGEDL